MSEQTNTTIPIKRPTRAALEELKVHPRETMDDVVSRLIQLANERREDASTTARKAS